MYNETRGLVSNTVRPTKMLKLIFILLLFIATNSLFASECVPVWSGSRNSYKSLAEYLNNLSIQNNSAIIITPKALNAAMYSKNSLSTLKQMDILIIDSMSIIYSEPCDKEAILDLYKINQRFLKDISNKKLQLNFSGVDSRVLPQIYNKHCKTIINIKSHEIFKTFIVNADSIPGIDVCKVFPAFLAAHGSLIVTENNKLYIKRSNNQFNLDAAKNAAPIN